MITLIFFARRYLEQSVIVVQLMHDTVRKDPSIIPHHKSPFAGLPFAAL
jgi:hypothetical protein